jgi:hypothetical protein
VTHYPRIAWMYIEGEMSLKGTIQNYKKEFKYKSPE